MVAQDSSEPICAGDLHHIQTPAILLDVDKVERNCERMINRAAALGVNLRPHMKTAKSIDVGRMATRNGSQAITVSTLAEAEYFAEAGFVDILYAVGISPGKLEPLLDLQRRHSTNISLLTDNVHAALDVDQKAMLLNGTFDIFIEIDCGGGRGGVTPEGNELLELGATIAASRTLRLAGVLTHAGHSYGADTIEEIIGIAEAERLAVVTAAARLRAQGLSVDAVSVGSTPTALCARSLGGVTEMRPGVYTLFDLDQVTLGLCAVEDIAVSVLATVIGHNPRSQRMLIDAGGLALSKDISAAKHRPDIGYGLVCPMIGGEPLSGLFVAEVHQEHGFVASELPIEHLLEHFPVGSRLRILPNHACMTAAAYDRYHLVRGIGSACLGEWPKATGW